MKINELNGEALDLAVANCEGLALKKDETWAEYSTDWAYGGPIIEREKIEIFLRDGHWFAYSSFSLPMDFPGDSPLMAAMRCYVAGMRGSHIELTGAEHD